MFHNKKQLLCSNNISLGIKKKIIKVVFVVLLFVDQKHGLWEKWREGGKCIWDMVLERNVKNKMDRQNNE